jgi:anti-sigma factor RsiW
MRCHRARILYEDYTSGALPLANMARVEEHLAGCPACREYFEQNDQIARALRRSSEVAHPGADYFDQLNARVLAELDQPVPRARKAIEQALLQPPSVWRRPLWWGGAAAAAALIALTILPATTPQPPGTLAARPATAPLTNPLPTAGISVANAVPASPAALAPPEVGAPLRKELQLASAPGALAMAAPIAPLNKGLGGIRSNDRIVESLINSNATPDRPAGDAQTFSPAQRQAAEDAAVKDVSYRKQPDPYSQENLPTEIYEKLQEIQTQLPLVGETGLVEHLRGLDAIIQRRSGGRAELRSTPKIRVPLLYLQAEDALSAGRPMDACTAFKGILLIDETSPLATRARLQLADLFFSEWADFRQADDNYRACAATSAQAALTSAERDHVQRQMERLDKFRAAGWEPLHLLHLVRTADWPGATIALRRLTEVGAATETLLPEAAKTIVERLNGAPRIGNEVSLQIYNLLEKQASLAQNGTVRAWLCLALGDLSQGQYQDARQAGDHYRHAITADAESGAAKAARIKLADLNERLLLDPVR